MAADSVPIRPGPLLYERPLHLLLGQSVEIDSPSSEEAIVALAADGAAAPTCPAGRSPTRPRAVRLARGVAAYEQVWRRLAAMPRPAPRPRPDGRPGAPRWP